MKSILLGLALSSIVLSGCATQKQKVSTPSGKWVVINPEGYVPPNTPVYVKKTDAIEAVNAPLSQAIITNPKGL